MKNELLRASKSCQVTTNVDPAAFLHQLLANEAPLAERRRNPRYAKAMVVDVLPADEQGAPCGASIAAITRDFSIDGLSLLVHQTTKAPKLIVNCALDGDSIRLVLRVVRTRQLTDWCHEIAGVFVQ